MRDDAVGLFWEDLLVNKGDRVARIMPPIPDTGWTPPRDFPNLAAAKVISLDTETFDPNLLTHGPGWARNDGHMVGLSVGVEDGHRWYFPFAHEVEPEDNLDKEQVLRWAAEQLGRAHQPKVGANLMYDVGWLKQEGVEVKGDLYDVLYAEPLIDETRKRYDLDSLGEKYLGEGKESNLLYEWCSMYYGGQPNGKQRANMYRTPPRLAGPYAESDADLPLRIMEAQYPLLETLGLMDVFKMECSLLPMLLAMRWRGVKVDVAKAEQVRDELIVKELEHQKQLDKIAGFGVNVHANEDLARLFDSLGLQYPRTSKGAPSFVKDWLNAHEHPVAQRISGLRKLYKTRSSFVEGAILDKNVDGRLYCQFHPLRGSAGGTVSGRYSSSTPNLQQIPARDPEIAPLLRGMFIPDDGYDKWVSIDYSQIEYRLLAHFATGDKGDWIRQKYMDDPGTDFHEATQQLIIDQTGRDIGRKPTKNVNFGLAYGMGEKKLARQLNLDRAGATEFFGIYHSAAPYVKDTFDHYADLAAETGEIRTILGRRSQFNLWEPLHGWDQALPYDEAVSRYGLIRRAYTHKALNRELQGSAADLMKKAMLKLWESGVFDALGGVPHLTVHDELDSSYDDSMLEALREMKHIMETALPLRVPVVATVEVGDHWGNAKAIKL